MRKCPYCDFNSHAADPSPLFESYVTRLLADLDADLRTRAARRPLQSIFIGGGTPSLFPGAAIHRLLAGIRARTDLDAAVEITLEANPGAADAERFEAFLDAGINRLSIGVQSLSATHLKRLGRIHDPDAARAAFAMARSAGFSNINLDMMFALPRQTIAEAAADLEALIALEPEHISYYQLTLEPNTLFHAQPPALPDADLTAEMGARGAERLNAAGYASYEVSAYARQGRACRHNLNYWRFGDYLGIGAGAHSKLTDTRERSSGWRIRRTFKHPHPTTYLNCNPGALVSSQRELNRADAVFELALNALRLTAGFEPGLFTATTGLPWPIFAPYVEVAVHDGLLSLSAERIQPTLLGRNFLDDLVARFIASEPDAGDATRLL